ncbi:MAG: metallophosphoesterase [Deltaproteobacteria bacterium]|jgi:hypothetical protein|nr:metallophosphoesterase [Deltaproteobacteria bacterium]
MIWAIGDIHGTFEPLRELVDLIRCYEKKDEPVDKIIFIGDYIDRGPSSKEVIDLIDALDYPMVRLAGNHEDLALRFINQDKRFLMNQGNVWFNNHAMATYGSLLGGKENAAKLDSIGEKYRQFQHSFSNQDILNSYEGAELPQKYETFLRNLQYSSREVFNIEGKELSFTFTHSLPYRYFPVQEQRVGSYDEFSDLVNKILDIYLMDRDGVREKNLNEKDISRAFSFALELSHIWHRDYEYTDYDEEFDPKKPIVGYQGEVIIHGHTPTIYYSEYYYGDSMGKSNKEQFKVYRKDSYLPFAFSRTPKAGYVAEYKERPGKKFRKNSGEFGPYGDKRPCPRYVCGDEQGVEAINIDTGAFFGGALTALGLSEKYLRNGLMPVLTVKSPAKDGTRDFKSRAGLIKIDHFGGPREVVYQKSRR